MQTLRCVMACLAQPGGARAGILLASLSFDFD